jgi:cholesterol oxidase
MSQTFDAIVIGSGFGGAVTACRLAEKGMKVLVLERGRRWNPQDYPRKPGDPWLFNGLRPGRQNGWLDLRFFRHVTVAQSAGVGGGSLAYSNVALEVHPSLFTSGWPAEITYDELKPCYDRVSAMMNLQTVPDGQLTQRFKLAREAANSLGHADRMSKAPLAVSFSPDWNYELADAFNPRHSRTFTNAQGQQQGTCIHLGNCEVGCDVRAKNTLDLNYLPRAEQLGAELRPLHLVRLIEPRDHAYRVVFDRISGTKLIRGEETASRVFLSAGSLGSSELLLRCRDQHGTLPRIGRPLGRNWSANANVLSLATYAEASRVQQTIGPPISGVIDFMDGHVDGHRFVVEDDGFPNVLMNALRASLADGEMRTDLGRSVLEHITAHVRGNERSRNLMVWLGAGMDAADGHLTLRSSLRDPSKMALDLSWKPEHSASVVEAIVAVHRRMTEATGGRLLPNPAWSLFKSLITLHPLGGCRMGVTRETGVVDHLGQVFGYPNLYVVDGSILPTAVGRNPSHTIAALAEHVAAHVH